MVSLMEDAFVARQTVFASSRRSRPAFGESGSGRPQLATEIGAVAALCNGQYWLIASCGARLDLLHVGPSSARLGRLDSAKFARDLKVGRISLQAWKEQVFD
jgi:hypothetical protein